MILVIAEKPSVGAAIGKVLGASSRKDGYLEGNNYIVSWCVGHLVGLADASSYDERFAKWRYSDLPIVPDEWLFEVPKDKQKQFKVLCDLMRDKRVTELVCATDAGREGELIFRLVYKKAGCTKPFKRLWISSLEDNAIREGFADLLRVNLSLLRRLIRTDTLVMETAQADCAMKTEYAICYCKDKASKTAVARVRRTLQEAKPEVLLDSSYFVPWLFPARWRLFAPVSYTERPASAAAKLCEGRIVILVNGSPSALVLPSLFCENFDCLDDYATTAVFSSFLRVLKYGSFYLSIFLPGVFVCLAVYLPELIPPQLLFKIAAAEKATPLPLFAEMLLVIILLEIIREAGLRMPQTLGHSVSLVAALIIGDAAIGAGLLSTPVILVASITAISVFVTPSLYEPATLLRLGVTLAAGLAGPVGLVCAALGVLAALTSISAMGVPYLSGAVFSGDGVVRRNYRALSRRPFTIWQRRGS